jgi:ADP-ribosylation factor related protein 1
MYALLSGLWKYLFQKEEYYVLILGLDNAGKTVCIDLLGIGSYQWYLCLA